MHSPSFLVHCMHLSSLVRFTQDRLRLNNLFFASTSVIKSVIVVWSICELQHVNLIYSLQQQDISHILAVNKFSNNCCDPSSLWKWRVGDSRHNDLQPYWSLWIKPLFACPKRRVISEARRPEAASVHTHNCDEQFYCLSLYMLLLLYKHAINSYDSVKDGCFIALESKYVDWIKNTNCLLFGTVEELYNQMIW